MRPSCQNESARLQARSSSHPWAHRAKISTGEHVYLLNLEQVDALSVAPTASDSKGLLLQQIGFFGFWVFCRSCSAFLGHVMSKKCFFPVQEATRYHYYWRHLYLLLYKSCRNVQVHQVLSLEGVETKGRFPQTNIQASGIHFAPPHRHAATTCNTPIAQHRAHFLMKPRRVAASVRKASGKFLGWELRHEDHSENLLVHTLSN